MPLAEPTPPPGEPGTARADFHRDTLPLLVGRVRGGVCLILASILVYVLADWWVAHERMAALVGVKVAQALLATALLCVLGRMHTWRATVAAVLVAFAIHAFLLATAAILRRDATVAPLLFIILTMGAGTLLPWGARPQLAATGAAGLAFLTNVVAVGEGLSGPFLYRAAALAVACFCSVYVAWELDRYRLERARAEAALAERARLEALRADVRTALGERAPLPQLLQACAEVLVQRLDGVLARIWTLDAAAGVLVLEASAGLAAEVGAPERRVPLGQFRIGRIALDREPHLTNALAEDPHPGYRAWVQRHGVVAFAGQPLLVEGRLVGVMAIFAPACLSVATLTALASVSDAIALTIERRRAEDALAASRRQLEEEAQIAAALACVGRDMISSLDTPVILDRLAHLTTEVLDCELSSTLLCDPREDEYVVVAAVGGGEGRGLGVPRAAIAGLLARLEHDDVAYASGWPDVVPSEVGRRLGAAGALYMTIRRGTEVIGIHTAGRRDPRRPWSRREERIARGIAQAASMALANARLVEELERAGRLKSEFVSTMSHELRTPLNVILGFADMLEDESREGAQWRDLIGRIKVSGRDLLELIENTLEVGKIEAGREEARFERVPLRQLWSALARGCERLPRADGVALDWQDDVPDVVLVTDPRKLAVVVRNLVGNALKFTERGSVRVEPWVSADAMVIQVADTGVGIHPADQEAIFEMFRQVDGSDSRRFGGAGLGLYIVRRFVAQLGGRVTLQSSPGEGSVFTVTLPRGPEAAPRRGDGPGPTAQRM
jgi:signal transduction histidine kinase